MTRSGKEQFNVNLPEELCLAVRLQVEQDGRSLSVWVERVLQAKLTEEWPEWKAEVKKHRLEVPLDGRVSWA